MNGSPDLSVHIGRLQLKNPVMPASGTFGYGVEYEEFFDLNRLGAIVSKTITTGPRTGSYPQRSTEVPAGFLASIGLQNVGIEKFIAEKLPFFDSISTPLIVSIGGQSIEDYLNLASILDKQSRVGAIELNISCPNVTNGGMHFGVDPDTTRKLVRGVRDVTDKPLIVKLTPMVTDIKYFAEVSQAEGADGISLINGVVGMAIDTRTRHSKLGRNLTGGLVGPAIKPLALYLVWQVCKTVDIPVIGIGGITSIEDALEFFIAGASAIQIGTQNFINPRVTVEIIAGISNYLQENKMDKISDLVGTFS